MKKPTTKKLPEKQVARTVTAKGKPFMKLFSDEKFYQYPRYTNVFVSQYGNVISTTGTVPHLLTPQLAPNKAWMQHTLDTGNYFGKKATAHDYEICKQSLEYCNDTEIYRKEVHEQFPALYPDDIENISNMSEEQSYLCCQIQATLLQRMRSSTPIDTSCWCTCPKKESQN